MQGICYWVLSNLCHKLFSGADPCTIKQGGDLNVIWRELLNSRRNEISMKVYMCVCVYIYIYIYISLPCFDVLCCVPDYWEGRL
jgi:hypothetical protein